MRCPIPILKHRTQEIVGRPHAEILVLEHHRAVRFAVEIARIALLNQGPGLRLFVLLGFDKLFDVRVPDFERVHFRRTPGLAAGFHHARNRVVHPQK